MRKSVVTPLTLGFLIMGALMGLLLFVSLYFATRLYLDYQRIVGVYIPRQAAAIHLRANLLSERWSVDRYLVNGEPSDRTQAEAARAQTSWSISVLQGTVEKTIWDDFYAHQQSYHALLDGLLYYSRGKGDDLEIRESQVDDALKELLDDVTAVQSASTEQARTAVSRYMVFFQRGFTVVLGIGAGLILFGAATGLTLGRSITRPLARLTEAARRLGTGDLSAIPEIPAANEIGALAVSFYQMAHNLGQAIERMRETASALTTSADRLSMSATSLSGLARGTLKQMEQIAQGAEAQRAQMHTASEVAASIADTLRQNAGQAAQVGQTAQGTQAQLKQAARVVSVLDTEAREVQSITAFIEQFARETHMLSLNAAIEARRAGEAGRGFAAVSDEMRALAERSARSASKVALFGVRTQTEMENVGQAVRQVQEAVAETAAFAEQTVHIARQQEQDTAELAHIVGQAAAVSETQARIAGQVSAAVAEQADEIAELAASAQRLTRLVSQLESLATRFLTSQGEFESATERDNEP
jgi:methyl-accepting chemotaxis protein